MLTLHFKAYYNVKGPVSARHNLAMKWALGKIGEIERFDSSTLNLYYDTNHDFRALIPLEKLDLTARNSRSSFVVPCEQLILKP